MTAETLKAARSAAEDFLHRAKDVEADAKTNAYTFITGNKITSALRRSSMELTRALAEMRKV